MADTAQPGTVASAQPTTAAPAAAPEVGAALQSTVSQPAVTQPAAATAQPATTQAATPAVAASKEDPVKVAVKAALEEYGLKPKTGLNLDSIPEIKAAKAEFTAQEKQQFSSEYNSLKQGLVADGMPEKAADLLAKSTVDKKADSLLVTRQSKLDGTVSNLRARYELVAKQHPEYTKTGLPQEVVQLMKGGIKDPVVACMFYDLDKRNKALTTENATLKATGEAVTANNAAQAAAIPAMLSSVAQDKEYVTPDEWDKLPGEEKNKRIDSGNFFKNAQKWGK